MGVQTAWLTTQTSALTHLKPGNHSNLWHWLQSVKWRLYIIAALLRSTFCAVLGWCKPIYKLLGTNPQTGGSLIAFLPWSKLLLFLLCFSPICKTYLNSSLFPYIRMYPNITAGSHQIQHRADPKSSDSVQENLLNWGSGESSMEGE